MKPIAVNGFEALIKLVQEYAFETVLDIGPGDGHHARVFEKCGKRVTVIDDKPRGSLEGLDLIVGRFPDDVGEGPWDALWACHVLEHTRNPGLFLDACFDCLDEDGILAITVPPRKDQIVGGHYTLWNTGLLLYHLVLAGFDCSAAAAHRYGYNCSVIVRKRAIPQEVLNSLRNATGDFAILRPYFPIEIGDKEFDGWDLSADWGRMDKVMGRA